MCLFVDIVSSKCNVHLASSEASSNSATRNGPKSEAVKVMVLCTL